MEWTIFGAVRLAVLSIFMAVFGGNGSPVLAGGPLAMALVGLSGDERLADWERLMPVLEEKGVRVLQTDSRGARIEIEYDQPTLFPKLNSKHRLTLEEIRHRLAQVVRESSRASFDLLPVLGAASECGQVERTLSIGVLDCKGCRYGAYSIAMKVQGVDRVWVDAEKSTLTFAYRPARVSRLYSTYFEPDILMHGLVVSALRKGRVEVQEESN